MSIIDCIYRHSWILTSHKCRRKQICRERESTFQPQRSWTFGKICPSSSLSLMFLPANPLSSNTEHCSNMRLPWWKQLKLNYHTAIIPYNITPASLFSNREILNSPLKMLSSNNRKYSWSQNEKHTLHFHISESQNHSDMYLFEQKKGDLRKTKMLIMVVDS